MPGGKIERKEKKNFKWHDALFARIDYTRNRVLKKFYFECNRNI